MTKAFALLCEHLTMHNLQTFNIAKCQEHLGNTLWCAQIQDYNKQVVSSKEAFHHQNARRGRLACVHQHGEGACGSIMFHCGEDSTWRHVHGTFHEPSPVLIT